MRTTLTLDEDIALELERRRRETDRSLKEEVNHLLRLGLLHEQQATELERPYRTRAVSTGRLLLGSLDDVADALSRAEGDSFP